MKKRNEDNRQFKIAVFRYDPTVDKESRYDIHNIPAKEGLTILGALTFVYENIDSSLAYSYSCLWGECRGCMVHVNGRTVKACLVELSSDVKIDPIPGYEIVKDLVVIDKGLVPDRRLNNKGATKS